MIGLLRRVAIAGLLLLLWLLLLRRGLLRLRVWVRWGLRGLLWWIGRGNRTLRRGRRRVSGRCLACLCLAWRVVVSINRRIVMPGSQFLRPVALWTSRRRDPAAMGRGVGVSGG